MKRIDLPPYVTSRSTNAKRNGMLDNDTFHHLYPVLCYKVSRLKINDLALEYGISVADTHTSWLGQPVRVYRGFWTWRMRASGKTLVSWWLPVAVLGDCGKRPEEVIIKRVVPYSLYDYGFLPMPHTLFAVSQIYWVDKDACVEADETICLVPDDR